MWIFTKYGFVSVVCARQGDGTHGQPVDPGRMMIRSRVRKHLEALRDRFPDLLGGGEVKEFAGTDYAYRLFVEKSVWSKVLVGLNDEMDYDNFKSEVARYQGRDGKHYEHSLHDVWSVTYKLQKGNRPVLGWTIWMPSTVMARPGRTCVRPSWLGNLRNSVRFGMGATGARTEFSDRTLGDERGAQTERRAT